MQVEEMNNNIIKYTIQNWVYTEQPNIKQTNQIKSNIMIYLSDSDNNY